MKSLIEFIKEQEELDEKRMSNKDRLKQRKYRRSAAGRKAARKHGRKAAKAGYRPNKRRARSHRIAAKRRRA